ncbi:MAG: hypothetical protein IPJ16_08990 [Bacteroidales bacterium]|nr:hypothetical protein [Bacteroidales bacterium]
MYRKFLAISFPIILGLLNFQNTYSQKFQHSILGGVNLAFEEPEVFNPGVTVEYQFEILVSKHFSFGISPYINIVNYHASTFDKIGTTVTMEKEMEISSGIPSISFYPKVSFPLNDNLNLFITTGLNGYSSFSSAFLTTTNYQSGEVVTKSYKDNSKIKLGFDASMGLQIYLTDKFDLITKLSWYSADVGQSINSLNFNGDWPSINVKSSILSFSAGLAFPIFQKK